MNTPTPAAIPKQDKGNHDWIREALGLPDAAPYRFDFYAQEIEALKLTQVMQPVEASQSELRAALEMLYADTADYITLNNLSAMNNGSMVRARKALGISVEVAAPVAPTEIERLAKVAIRECPWKPDQHPNDWSDAALQVCRAVVSGDALSAAKPKVLSDAQMAEVWIPYDQGIGTRRDLITRILALQAGGEEA